MTDWRTYGPVARGIWQRELFNAGSPLYDDEAACYAAAGDHSALCLAMLFEESKYGTAFNRNVAANHNPLNLRPSEGDGYLRFERWADGIRAWTERITNPAYKGGIYARTTDLRSLIDVYAPATDSNRPAEYVATLMAKLMSWGTLGKETQAVPTQAVRFGRVPKPPIIELICSKIGPGHGYTQVPPRQNVGICEHITDGRGSVEFYHDFFSIGGEREADALVDFVVGRDGRIAMLNDWRGTRAPWANGNTAGQEGDGPAFIATFGIAGVNNRLVSIEHEGRAADDWTGEQWNASVALDAWLFDQMGVRFDSFPVHQGYGVVTHLLHSEFTDKGGNALDECPGRYLKQHINQFQAAIKAVMMAHQVDAPATPDKPKPAPIWWDRDDIGVQVNGNGDRALAMLAETHTRDKEATLYSVAVAKKQYALGTVKPGTTLALRGTSRSKAGRKFAFVEIPGHPDQVARIVASNLVETWPNL